MQISILTGKEDLQKVKNEIGKKQRGLMSLTASDDNQTILLWQKELHMTDGMIQTLNTLGLIDPMDRALMLKEQARLTERVQLIIRTKRLARW